MKIIGKDFVLPTEEAIRVYKSGGIDGLLWYLKSKGYFITAAIIERHTDSDWRQGR